MRIVAKEAASKIEAWFRGRSAPIAGSKAQVNWVRDDPAAPIEDEGGFWSSDVIIDHGIAKDFDSSVGQAGGPATPLYVSAKNSGSPADVVGVMGFTNVAADNGVGFGANFGVMSSAGATNYKLQGMEIDLEPETGTTWAEGGGIVLNVFTMQSAGPAIYFEGIFGGKWSTGINVGNLSDNGSGISPAPGTPRMGTLLDSGTANYQIAAVKLNNTHKIRLEGTSTAAAAIYNHSNNILRMVGGSSGIAFRNNADSATTLLIGDGALGNYANDAGAAAGGVAVGQMYRNGSALQIRVT
jgi:hypothetical protein